MAKKDNINSESTTVSSRLDIVAKNIINRSAKSYRQILEKRAYTSIKEGLNDNMFVSDEEIEDMEQDLSDLKLLIKENNDDIEHYKNQIQIRMERNERLEKKFEELKEKLTEIKEDKEYLNKVREEYCNQIIYSIDDAVSEVESVLAHNAELRKNGPRARVKELDIKNICKKYKVSIKEVMPKVDHQYLDCLDNYEKYL